MSNTSSTKPQQQPQARVVLGQRPATFAPFAVRFVGPQGQELVIPDVVYKYRTRSEFAAFADAQNSAAVQAYEPQPGQTWSVSGYLAALGDNNVAALLDSIVNWGLPEPVDQATLSQMQDECPAALAALWAAYGNAARDGRLGN